MTPSCPKCGAELPATVAVVRDVTVILAPPEAEERGLLAWAACRYGGVAVHSLAVRRTRENELIVTFPADPRTRSGRRFLVQPVECGVRHQFEAAILPAYFEARRKAGRRAP